jgi:hypothetical protein
MARLGLTLVMAATAIAPLAGVVPNGLANLFLGVSLLGAVVAILISAAVLGTSPTRGERRTARAALALGIALPLAVASFLLWRLVREFGGG